jgi:hypothetical protein
LNVRPSAAAFPENGKTKCSETNRGNPHTPLFANSPEPALTSHALFSALPDLTTLIKPSRLHSLIFNVKLKCGDNFCHAISDLLRVRVNSTVAVLHRELERVALEVEFLAGGLARHGPRVRPATSGRVSGRRKATGDSHFSFFLHEALGGGVFEEQRAGR